MKESLNLITSVHALIGFCDSLKPGTVITEGYMYLFTGLTDV